MGYPAMAAGFADPVLDSQATFRAVLAAMAEPGRIVPLAPRCEAPEPLRPAIAALALTLLDYDTPVWLDGAADTPAVSGWLALHTGAPAARHAGAARFAIVADAAGLPPLTDFDPGDPQWPDRSATLLVQVAGLDGGPVVRLRGPGIRTSAGLAVAGLAGGFWRQWRELRALHPCGVDVVFAGPEGLAALPRSIDAED